MKFNHKKIPNPNEKLDLRADPKSLEKPLSLLLTGIRPLSVKVTHNSPINFIQVGNDADKFSELRIKFNPPKLFHPEQ